MRASNTSTPALPSRSCTSALVVLEKAGAFLPGDQAELQADFKRQLARRFDVTFDNRQQMLEADAREKDDDVDFASQQTVSKIDSDAVVFQGDFAHGRADVR